MTLNCTGCFEVYEYESVKRRDKQCIFHSLYTRFVLQKNYIYKSFARISNRTFLLKKKIEKNYVRFVEKRRWLNACCQSVPFWMLRTIWPMFSVFMEIRSAVTPGSYAAEYVWFYRYFVPIVIWYEPTHLRSGAHRCACVASK